MKTILKTLAWIIGVIVGILLCTIIWLVIISPGKPEPIRGHDGKILKNSISVIEKLNIGGVDQYVIIRGNNKDNPVLLFLHGGPGSPEYPFFKMQNRTLEKYMTIAHWEQRGAGKSYSDKIPDSTMNVEQFLADTIELSEKLRAQFHKDKIYLLGHSWGSALGMLAIQKRPDLFKAYIGVGQAVNLEKSEKLAYAWVKSEAKRQNNAKALKELESIGPPPYPIKEFYKKKAELMWVIKFGGGMVHDTKNLMGVMISAILKTGEYSFMDKVNYIRGNNKSLRLMWDQLGKLDLEKSVKKLDIPVYIMQGKYDYQVSTPLAEKLLDSLDAPKKKFYLFEQSAHGTIYEEPAKFLSIMTNDVINDTHPPIPPLYK